MAFYLFSTKFTTVSKISFHFLVLFPMSVYYHSYCPAVRWFNNGYVGKQPVAWKEYCAEYRLKNSRIAWIGALAVTIQLKYC